MPTTRRPEAIETRPPRPDDAHGVATLVTAATSGWLGCRQTTAETILDEWRAPGVHPDRDARVAVSAHEVIGYALLQPAGRAQSTFWLDVWTAPGAAEGAIAADLLHSLQSRVTERASRAPLAATVRLRVQVEESRSGVRATLQQHGFAVVRSSLHMVTELDQISGTPTWSNGVRVRTFVPSDARALHALTMEVLGDTWEFTPEPFDTWVAGTEAPEFDPSLWWIAEHDGELIAAMLCRVDDADPELVWLQVVGVRRAWRGRWLALNLFLHAAQEFHARGLRRAGAGVDASNPSGANLLAGRGGFQVARRYLIYEKQLRGRQPIRRLLRRARRVVGARSSQ